MSDDAKAAPRPIKLRACDDEDLKVIAALLQDALVELGDMAYLSNNGRFAAVFDRFMWEGAAAARPDLNTVRCGVCFEGVERVRVCGIDQRNRKQVLELLTIVPARDEATAAENGAGTGNGTGGERRCAIHLLFAGGGIVRIEARSVECRVEDLGAPRPAPVRPRHPVAPMA